MLILFVYSDNCFITEMFSVMIQWDSRLSDVRRPGITFGSLLDNPGSLYDINIIVVKRISVG